MEEVDRYMNVRRHYQVPNNKRLYPSNNQDQKPFTSITRPDTSSDVISSESETAGKYQRFIAYLTKFPWRFALICSVFGILMIGLGIVFGFLAFKSSSNDTSNGGVTSDSTSHTVTSILTTTSTAFFTSSTSKTTTPFITPNSTNLITTSTSSGSTTTLPHTTSSSSVETATTIQTTTTTTTTTTSFIPADICPPSLADPFTTQLILTLDQTDAPTSTFQKYSFQYFAPSSATTAMLIFEFITVWGSWYLDDVSIKRADGTGAQLIDNGGFEVGNLGSKWKYCDTRYSWMREGTVVSHTQQSGVYSYESKDTSSGSDEFLTQIMTVQGGEEYDVEFYLWMNGDTISAQVSVIFQ